MADAPHTTTTGAAEAAVPAPERATAVEFRGVSKTFSRRMSRGFLRQHMGRWVRRSPEDLFHALRNVSFTLSAGDSLAIIGSNGAGKSTLLTLTAGITEPSAGEVKVNGRVAALLELGAGFHPDLTGAENVRLNASLLGFSRKRTLGLFDEIVEFSGVAPFIHEPLRTYSSGMVVRLAFSVAVNVDPDILVIDEVLAVGDQNFQAKCLDRIRQFRAAGKTMLCVSHDVITLGKLCDRAVWLERGEVVREGPIADVLASYQHTRTAR